MRNISKNERENGAPLYAPATLYHFHCVFLLLVPSTIYVYIYTLTIPLSHPIFPLTRSRSSTINLISLSLALMKHHVTRAIHILSFPQCFSRSFTLLLRGVYNHKRRDYIREAAVAFRPATLSLHTVYTP